MPQDQLTKEDEQSAARLRAAGLVSLAGLLGIPVAEAGRKQFVGNKILKMMERGDLGKDFLAKGGNKVAGTEYLQSTKEDAPRTNRDVPVTKSKITSSQVRKSAVSPSLRQQIHDIVAGEVERLKGVTSGVTKPVTEALDADRVNKSIRRKVVPQQKRAGAEATRRNQARYEERVKRANDAKAAAAAKRIDADVSHQIIGMNADARARGVGAKINETITNRLPEIGKERSRLVTARNKMVKELGEKPKRGRTQASRDAAIAWDAKQKQITAINDQIAKLDEVIKPSGQLRVNPQIPVKELPGAAASIVGRMPGTDPTSTFLNAGDTVASARQQYNTDITDLGRLQSPLPVFGDFKPPTPYVQPQGVMSFYTDPADPSAGRFTGSFPGAVETQHYYDIAGPGAPQYTPQEGIVPHTGDTAREQWLAKYDPSGMQAIQDQFSSTIDQFNPDNVRSRYDPTGQTMVSPAERTSRIMGMAAARRAGSQSDPTLIDRILNMFNVGGSVPQSVATNLGAQSTIQAKNAVATKKWQQNNKGVTLDLNNPQHVEQLALSGWQDPLTARQSSAVTNAANTVNEVGDIKAPRTRLGMNAAAADAGRVLGLKGTQTWNPDLKVGDVNLGKLNRWATGGSLLSGASMVGYNYLRGKGAEKDAAAAAGAKANVTPPTQATAPDKLEEWAIKGWNMIAGKKGNKYQTGQDVYNAVVSEAEGRGYLKGMSDDNKKKVKSLWMTYAKQRDGGK